MPCWRRAGAARSRRWRSPSPARWPARSPGSSWPARAPPGRSGRRRLAPAWLVAASLAPLLALQIAFPEGGTFPFPATELVLLLTALIAGVLVLPAEQRVLRTGFAIYAVVAVAAFLVPSPLGYNCGRLALIAVGPLLACALRGRRALLLAATAPLLLFWSWAPSASDLEDVGGPSASAAYYAPLESFLARHDEPPARVEIPFTKQHWEAVYVARHFMLARGWERQLDRERNPIFYQDRKALDPDAYLRWLRAAGVRYVAVPDAPAGRVGPGRGRRDRRPPLLPRPGLELEALGGLRGPRRDAPAQRSRAACSACAPTRSRSRRGGRDGSWCAFTSRPTGSCTGRPAA